MLVLQCIVGSLLSGTKRALSLGFIGFRSRVNVQLWRMQLINLHLRHSNASWDLTLIQKLQPCDTFSNLKTRCRDHFSMFVTLFGTQYCLFVNKIIIFNNYYIIKNHFWVWNSIPIRMDKVAINLGCFYRGIFND